MAQLCMVWGCCSAEWYLFCFSSFGLGCSLLSLLYSKPSSSVLLISDLLPAAAIGCWNIWSWPCGEVFQLHCILSRLYDDCPNEGTSPCGLAFYILLCIAYHLYQVLLKCPGMVVIHLALVLLW